MDCLWLGRQWGRCAAGWTHQVRPRPVRSRLDSRLLHVLVLVHAANQTNSKLNIYRPFLSGNNVFHLYIQSLDPGVLFGFICIRKQNKLVCDTCRRSLDPRCITFSGALLSRLARPPLEYGG